jgi:hypothetical protein
MPDTDLATVYNAVQDYLYLYKDGVSQHLQGATALPAGHAATDLTDWYPDEHHVAWRIYWEPRSSWFSPTDITIGATWEFGGRLNGRGRYITNATMYCSVASLTGTHTYDVTGQWGEATLINSADPANPVAKLLGYATIRHEHMTLHEETINLVFSVKGDGSGRVYQR